MRRTGAFLEPRPEIKIIRPCTGRARSRRVLIATELLTGGSALLSGGLLAVRPDGSLLGLPTSVLVGGPFADWRLPGLLLGTLVGVGFLAAGTLERGQYRRSGQVSCLAGAGLIGFEAVEWRWLGFHPLQLVFMVVGAGVIGLAVAGLRSDVTEPLPDPTCLTKGGVGFP